MADEKILDEVREMGHALGFQRGLEVAARVVDALDPEKPANWLHSRSDLSRVIRMQPGGPGQDAGVQDAVYRSYLAKVRG